MTNAPHGSNPYFLGTVASFKELYEKKRAMEANFRPDMISEYTSVSNQYLSTAVELLKLGIDRLLTDDMVTIYIDNDDYDIPRKEIFDKVGDKQWNVLFPLDELDKDLDDDDFENESEVEEADKVTHPYPNEYPAQMMSNPFGAFLTSIFAPFMGNMAAPMPEVNSTVRTAPVKNDNDSDILDDLTSFHKKVLLLEKERDAAQETVSVIRQKYDEIKRIVKEKDEAMATDKAQNDELLKSLDEEIEQYQEKICELELSVQEKTKIIEGKEERVTRVTKELSDKSRSYDSLRDEKNSILKQLETIKAELEQSKIELENIKKQAAADIEQCNKRKAAEIEELTKSLNQKRNAEVEELNRRNSAKCDELTKRAGEDLDSLRKKLLSEAEENVKKLKAETEDRLMKAKNAATSEMDSIRAKARDTEKALSDENTSLKEKIAEKDKTIEQDAKKTADMQSKINTLTSERDKANSERDKAASERDRANSDRDRIASDLDTAKNNIANLNKQIEDLKKAKAEVEEKCAKIEHLAYFDEKVGVMNLNAFNRDFPEKNIKGSVLVMLGIRDIKAINAMHGRSTGDRVIGIVSDKLIAMYGEKNVYRIMGDQFVICLEDAIFTDIRNQILDIQQALFNENIGIAYGIVPGNECDSHGEMLEKAESAMNQMKRQSVSVQSAGQSMYSMSNDEEDAAPAPVSTGTEEVNMNEMVMEYMKNQLM